MSKRIGIFTLIIFCLINLGFGQKVKYKDLFILLNSKKYDQAKPFLEIFLANPKNVDHPNGNYQMGLIFQDKLEHTDVLDETVLYKSNADSALQFLNKAITLVTEKEIKKNDAFYQAFNRRDLRTGKFGIKISDVHLDLENRVKDLESSRQNVSDLKKYYLDFSESYVYADSLFVILKNKYGTNNNLLWKSGEEDQSIVEQISASFDQTRSGYNNYRRTLEKVKNSGYDQQIRMKEVEDLNRTDNSKINFKEQDILIYDYKSWGSGIKNELVNAINPLREKLIIHDKVIEALRIKVNQEVVEVWEELGALKNNPINNELMAYDPDPLPVGIFNYKTEEINYLSGVNRYNLDGSLDSLDVNFQIRLSQQLLEDHRRFEFLSRALLSKNVVDEAAKYRHFINTNYGSVGELERFISGRTLFVQNQKDSLEKRLSYWEERNVWVLSETDSISLISIPSYTIDPSSANYLPFWTGDSLTHDLVYSSGLMVSGDTLKGYNLGADAKRNISFFNLVDLEPLDILQDHNQIASFSEKSEDYFITLYYNKNTVDAVYKSLLVKVAVEGQTRWIKDFSLPQTPYNMDIDKQTGDIIIYYGLESAEAESSGDVDLLMIFDAAGNIKK